jgi:hypothetical protein
MGSAALAGGQRISSAQLNSEVTSYNQSFQKYHGQVQQQFSSSQTPAQVLGWLVSFQVADRMAERYKITVTPAQQHKALDSIVASLNAQEPGVTTGVLAAALGLAPDMVSSFARFEAIQSAVADKLDGGNPPEPGSAAAQQLNTKFTASGCRAAKSLGIQVNPQFGNFDYALNLFGAYSVVPASPTLSKSVPATASSPGTQLTPHC